MTSEQQLVEALQTTINTQAQLIEFLKSEIDRLKAAQFVDKLTTPPSTAPGAPYTPSQPWPFGPGLLPYPQQPCNPFPLPYVITCGVDGSSANVGSNIKCVTTTPLPPIDLE